MPQIGWLEILAVVIIAILVLGPKEFPIALKKIGSYIGKLKNTFSNFQREISSATDEINIENDLDLLSFKKKIELKCIDIFQKFDELGHYTQYSWFYELDKRKLLKFINELRDVWEYRLNLTTEIKKAVCPPLGRPFQMLNIHSLFNKDIEKIKNSLFESKTFNEPFSEFISIISPFLIKAIGPQLAASGPT